MKILRIGSLVALSGLSATALYAAQPPDSVSSDGNANTAMGSAAMVSLVNPTQGCVPSAVTSTPYMMGCFNTAAGDDAMLSNTTGAANTAIGTSALSSNYAGSFNTAVGSLSMYSLNGATGNSAFGASSLFSDTSGYSNTASGSYSMFHNTTGYSNTASGYYSLNANTTGIQNTATGVLSMYSNTGGGYNTANGAYSLYYNTGGASNTAVGWEALLSNTTGNSNTGSGYAALVSNTIGGNNTAAGAYALYSNSSGGNMTAVGYGALYSNTTGTGNNAQGYEAMYSNTTGSNNSAIGDGALYSSTTGIGNNAVGLTALENMTTGVRNTAIGNNAGLNLISGNYNTYIGWGVNGSTGGITGENYVTRIGVTYADPNVNVAPTTYVTGIYNSAVAGGIPVVVNSLGQLGFAGSSERFKTGIAALGATSDRLGRLRPVSFHVKTDPGGAIQYGLIAEEVDKVYPELVIRDRDGRIQGVRYDELTPLLLNEMQKQRETITAQSGEIRALEAQHELKAASQDAEIRDLRKLVTEMQAELHNAPGSDGLVALR
jgi:hypothetical protein